MHSSSVIIGEEVRKCFFSHHPRLEFPLFRHNSHTRKAQMLCFWNKQSLS